MKLVQRIDDAERADAATVRGPFEKFIKDALERKALLEALQQRGAISPYTVDAATLAECHDQNVPVSHRHLTKGDDPHALLLTQAQLEALNSLQVLLNTGEIWRIDKGSMQLKEPLVFFPDDLGKDEQERKIEEHMRIAAASQASLREVFGMI